MKILITGAAGYQARFLISRLRDRHALSLFDRAAAPGIITGDITSFADVKAACAGQDAVVHLVALVRDRFGQPHERFADVMVKGTWNVAEACAQEGVKTLINVSSIVAGGWPADVERPYHVGDPQAFQTADLFYSLAKLLGEEICRAYHEAHGLRAINLRPAMIAGDGANPDPRRPADPPRHWFLHVHPEDVAQAVERALESRTVEFGSFNVIAGRDDALFDWHDTAERLGWRPERNWPQV